MSVAAVLTPLLRLIAFDSQNYGLSHSCGCRIVRLEFAVFKTCSYLTKPSAYKIILADFIGRLISSGKPLSKMENKNRLHIMP